MAARGAAKPSYSPPEVLDGYRIVRLLGRGAMGYVYLAEDTLLDRPVALKLIAQRRPDEAARRRFREEARALARLAHPNVVAVHRAGEVDGHPYLVTELIRGTPLSELPKPLDAAQLIAIAVDLARGLAAAHRKGVLHRDLTPANAILSEDGDAKLIDFGLAIVADPEPRARDEGGPELAGTPRYMAPETLRGAPATMRSDLYSFGAVLYELCTGSAPRDTLASDVDEETWITGAADPPQRRISGLDPRLAAVVSRCLAPVPEDRFPSADALVDALAALLARRAAPPVPEGNPYRGLAAFEAEHRALFFGRSGDARALVERLREQALAVVTGDSGVGKSSLCRAGVLPLILDGAFADGRRYHPVTMLPGKRPYAALVTALSAVFSLDEAAIALDARDDPAALARALRRALGKEQGAIVLVDQAEELVTLADPAEARAFAEILSYLPAAPAGVRVLVAVRGDFFTRLAALPGFAEELARALYLLRPLSAEGVRAAILGPAAWKDVTFEPASLVDTLAAGAIATSGGLPLLQFTLAELWEARKQAPVITPSLLDALGGVEGALARHADAVITALPPDARAASRRLLLSLVTADDTRIRRSPSDLDSAAPAPRAALDALVRGRLVVAREIENETAYELAHEALIKDWGTLRGWLREGGEVRLRRDRVETAAVEWERLQRSPELVLGGKRLAEAEGLLDEDLSPRARALIEASRARARRERLRRWGQLAGLLVIVVVLVGVRWKEALDLDRLIAGRVAAAEAMRDEGRTTKDQADAGRRRAYALFDVAHDASADETAKRREEAEAIWADALALSRAAEISLVRAGQALESALALDPTRTAIRGTIGDVTLDRLLLAEAFHVDDRRADLLLLLGAYDHDGSRRRTLQVPPSLSLVTSPPGATVTLERYEDRQGRKVPVRIGELGITPLRGVSLPSGPGSYRLVLAAPGRVEVRYPVLLAPGERFEAALPLPESRQVPPGYLFVPAGRFLGGSADPEGLRKGMLNAEPLHEVQTGAFLIAARETTFGEWIAFLDSVTPEERTRRSPSTQSRQWGVELTRDGDGTFRITLSLNGRRIQAREGEPLRLSARSSRAELDWRSLPVSGVSFDDIEAYLLWLRDTGRLPGARPCDEREWERAARGADGRSFPHGEVLSPDDADFDLTYGRRPLAFGPDEVGAHPVSMSPFGLLDATGNVYEWAWAAGSRSEVVIRGGSWYYDSLSQLIANRTGAERSTRDIGTGLRACAAAPPP